MSKPELDQSQFFAGLPDKEDRKKVVDAVSDCWAKGGYAFMLKDYILVNDTAEDRVELLNYVHQKVMNTSRGGEREKSGSKIWFFVALLALVFIVVLVIILMIRSRSKFTQTKTSPRNDYMLITPNFE